MNGQNNKIRIKSEPFRQFTSTLYKSAGVPEAEADAVAGMQVETDERGVFSHGTRALPGYVRGILNGEINPKPTPQILTDAPSTALVDADNSLGHVAGIYAMNMAIEKAETTGFASVAVRNSNHYGAAACFAMMALPKGMIGFSTTKTGGASVVPHGGMSGLLGNHPVGYAIPTKAELPIVLDMAVWADRVGTCRNVCNGREAATTRLCIGRGRGADARSASSERDAALWGV